MIGEHLAIVTWARAYRIKCHCSKTEGVGHYTPYKQGDNCLQPASEIYQQFLFSWKLLLEDWLGNYVWKFYLDILGLCWQTECVLNLIQRDLLRSITTLDSILSVVILTFWELILGLGALFHIFLVWGSLRKQFRSPLIHKRFWTLLSAGGKFYSCTIKFSCKLYLHLWIVYSLHREFLQFFFLQSIDFCPAGGARAPSVP